VAAVTTQHENAIRRISAGVVWAIMQQCRLWTPQARVLRSQGRLQIGFSAVHPKQLVIRAVMLLQPAAAIQLSSPRIACEPAERCMCMTEYIAVARRATPCEKRAAENNEVISPLFTSGS
jgi:hypothetical protein